MATPLPVFESDAVAARLAGLTDPEERAFLNAMAQDGFAVIDLGEAAHGLCDQAVADTDPYFADPAVGRVQDAWLRSPAVRKLASDPKIRRMLEVAFGRPAFPFQTLNFKRGSQQHLHSDTIHFSSLPERFMCGVWIALEDVRPEAGPVVYKPGSHKLPILTMRDVGVNTDRPGKHDYDRYYVPRFAERVADMPSAHAVIRKGQAFVWAANLAHGGSPIQDPQSTRRSLVVHFYFDDCVYYTPMMSDVEGGRLFKRLPADISTGLWKWPKAGGRPVALPLTTIARAMKQRLVDGPAAS